MNGRALAALVLLDAEVTAASLLFPVLPSEPWTVARFHYLLPLFGFLLNDGWLNVAFTVAGSALAYAAFRQRGSAWAWWLLGAANLCPFAIEAVGAAWFGQEVIGTSLFPVTILIGVVALTFKLERSVFLLGTCTLAIVPLVLFYFLPSHWPAMTIVGLSTWGLRPRLLQPRSVGP